MLNMPSIKNRIEQYRLFWRLKYLNNQFLFILRKRIYTFKESSSRIFSRFNALWSFLHSTIAIFLFAIVSSFFIQYLDTFISPYALKIGLPIPDSSIYTTLFGTIAGIGGVFIGLYYTAISTILSAIYSKIPSNIRDLLANERVGHAYMALLAYMTFSSLFFLTLHLLGFPAAYSAIVFIILLSGIGIISFVKLGQRAFIFFDPTKFAIYLIGDLTSYLKHVQPNAFRWLDPIFQNHARQLALRSVDALDTLSDMANNEKHLNGKSFINFAERVCFFLSVYQNAKSSIPTNSMWYGQKYIQRNWYKTEEIYLHTATLTGTKIPPEAIPDKEWLDDRLIGIVKQCILINYKAGRYELVLQIIDVLDIYLQKSAELSNLKQAFKFIDEITNDFIESLSEEKDFLKQTDKLEIIAIFERVASLSINILLKYNEYLKTHSCKIIENKLSIVDWTSRTNLYKHKFSPHLLKQIESFSNQLEYEVKAEGKVISPNWYLTELVILAEATLFAECINELIQKSAKRFKSWSDDCAKKKRFWLSAAVQSRELEYWNKLEYYFKLYENSWQDILEIKHLNGLQWPAVDIMLLKSVYSRRQKDLLGEISKQGNLLLLLHRPDDFPDYAGQFLHLTAHSILSAICEPDEALLIVTYKPFFFASMMKFQELRPKINPIDWRFENQISIATAPLIDLLDLSGYSRLMSAYHNKPTLWKIVTDTWDEYLNDKETPADVINIFAASVDLIDSRLGIPYRGITRTEWKQKVERMLDAVPKKNIHDKDIYRIPFEEVDHCDPIIRIFARNRLGSFYDGVDIFISEYVLKKDNYKKISFGRRREQLPDQIHREEIRYKESISTNKGDL